jgi:hypothetical protein
VTRHLHYARERPAEGVALRAARRTASARQAFNTFAALPTRLAAASPAVHPDCARTRIARDLLEQQFTLATEPPELPAGIRDALTAPVEAAAREYAPGRTTLPARTRDSLFFAEKEACWAGKTARAGAAQSL